VKAGLGAPESRRHLAASGGKAKAGHAEASGGRQGFVAAAGELLVADHLGIKEPELDYV
jgi:hypothetical protein